MTVTELPPASKTRRLPIRLPSGRVLLAVAVVALLGMLAVLVIALVTGRDAQKQAATVAQDTAPAVLTLDVLCKRNDQLGADLRAAAACGDKIDKAKSAVDGQPQPPVAAGGLSRDDVTAIVTGQLAGKSVTVDQVMNLVTQVYNANRPKDAPAPTADQVLSAVTAVCGSTKCQGAAGLDAPPASADDIFAQVARYCSGDSAPCRGREGERGGTGAQGVSVVRQYFDRDEGGTCRNFTDFSDGRTRIDSGPAGDAACPAAPPPVTPTP